jgi:hypothetical protein
VLFVAIAVSCTSWNARIDYVSIDDCGPLLFGYKILIDRHIR